MLWTVAVTLCMGLAALLILLYSLKRGQFENIEDVKYQMFRDDSRQDDHR